MKMGNRKSLRENIQEEQTNIIGVVLKGGPSHIQHTREAVANV